ncbi:melatonin receptor type 1B-B-like [Nematostella vectensis]|uniref:melatonin receptor type 1B-B-like n=1 Tax=Nematostella vectensis TaxID=45351 RepID=UPI002076FD2E|nr:melatonin receptor type 1B-B-like [Nematostella vectensis]XP_048589091.1 melatonin receptor type 1B-B-like [Nematostella vectensis]XP_048589092.1 melatonin receptor type 1B-B-like [Nematostella vectensis]
MQGPTNGSSPSLDPLGRGKAQIVLEVSLAVLMCVVSAVGNILVLWVIRVTNSLHTVTNMFIQNLACIDLLITLLQIPLWTVSLYYGEWTIGDTLCKSSAFVFYMLSNAALYNLLMIALNRYVRVVKYDHYQCVFGLKKVPYAMIAVTWILPLVTCSGPLYDWGEFRFYANASMCTLEWSSRHWPYYVFMLALQPSPYIIVYCYFEIYTRVRQNRIQVCSRKNRAACQSASDAENQTMIVAFMIICVFVTSWLPAVIIAALEIAGVRTDRWLAALSSYMVFVSTCLHPAIYGLLNPPFRKAFTRQLKRHSLDTGDPKTATGISMG